MKKGLLLSNIGTPDSSSTEDVKIYLDEFLMDPDVIPLPNPFRWLLVKGLITPRRSSASAAKYQAVWLKEGSPLRVYSQNFAEKLQTQLGQDWIVRVGMRYGNPSMAKALADFKAAGVQEILFAPMYPQFAEATTGSSTRYFKKIFKTVVKGSQKPAMKVLKPFFADPNFIKPQAELIRPLMKTATHLLFSFHGLPEAQIKKNPGCLQSSDCCERPQACAMNCYRAQSLKTAQELACELNLQKSQWSVSFQSRLGRAKWIGPPTEETLRRLAASGVKDLAVACPSFVADCLETLEEIGLEGKNEFLKAGGTTYQLAPCLNSEDSWAQGLAKILSEPQKLAAE